MSEPSIRALRAGDVPSWKRLRSALWPELTDAENDQDSEKVFSSDRWAVFVCDAGDEIRGFVEVSLRHYAEGCDSSPVGCIEGWFVDAAARRRSAGRRLVVAAEDWARANGCTEMASQALLDNVDGQRAHEHLGYAEVERQVCFRKDLQPN